MASREMEELKTVMQEMMARGLVPRFDGCIDPDRLRAVVQTAQERMPSEPGVSFHPCELGGIEAEQSLPEGDGDSAVILYIHGGGLICGNARTSRGYASLLAGET